MKTRPILFSAPMVRAILNGTKTQTRRAVNDRRIESAPPACFFQWLRERCPYGQPGDRLWVRETGWERPERTLRMMREGADTWDRYYYDADGLVDSDHDQFKEWGFKRRPSIHMPRWASRILLEITAVRLERLQTISAADAIAEGVCELPLQAAERGCWWTGDVAAGAALHGRTPSGAYRLLWEAINNPGSWDANPLVWVIEFKRVEGGEA